ncbi:gliding motility protein GldB-related protein [Tenacibaculum soleae]|uniref:gliding motility protein GldB-related protein n=1 Tax=Tenacibaculum soleae TaxID=447689 RepID=UPI002300C5A1|nr:hypothetical protein [Tenacibaculum soleae]
MKKTISITLLIFTFWRCDKKVNDSNLNIITSDITNFWKAYDKITSTQDSILQYKYIDSLYFKNGTAGLSGIRQARNYTSQDYINSINNYPKFWTSVRENTLKTKMYVSELNQGIEKIRKIYPELKPARIYFTIGALRTNGTTIDSLVLIGSELAMSDKNTIASEFQGDLGKGRRKYFDSNPIDNLVLLNIHEYVHTQQNEQVDNLLSYTLREGIAEFVSVIAMEVPSAAPAINYGKQDDKVKKKFEEEMFYGNNIHHWLWSDFPNEFKTRDLGYYIGYAIAEINYNKAKDKQSAIKEMIELDYTNETQIEDFVNRTNFFSTPLDKLYQIFENKRPTVVRVKQFENKAQNISPKTKEITIEFSQPLNGHHTSVDFGNLGQDAFPKGTLSGRNWGKDNTSWTIPVELEPNKKYQIFITNNFRTEEGIPLKPFLIEFKTSK